MLTRVSDLEIGDRIVTKNQHAHIKVFIVEGIENLHCQMHGEYICKLYNLRKIRSNGSFGSIAVCRGDGEINCEKLIGNEIPVCHCKGCNQPKKDQQNAN